MRHTPKPARPRPGPTKPDVFRTMCDGCARARLSSCVTLPRPHRYTLSVTAPKSKRIAFETARLSLARHVVAGEETRMSALGHAAAVSAVALRIERVGIWYFEDDEQRLVCQSL